MDTSESNTLSTSDEQIAPDDFFERLCLVTTSNAMVNDIVAPENEVVAAYQLWPALKYNSIGGLLNQIKDEKQRCKIILQYNKFCRNVGISDTDTTNSDESGIAYLIGRNESQSTFASVPKNDEGVIVEDNQSVFDFCTHIDEIERAVGYCGSAQFQAAYTLAINRMEQYFAMNAEKEELEKTSTPSAPGDIDVSGGGTDTEKAESASNGVISMLKSTVSTVTRKVSGALSNISPHCHDVTKILPSNDHTSKSTDTEESELSVYPDSGALVAPPKVKDVLTGGKRKEGSKPTRRKKKRQKSKSKNDNCLGGARIVDTPLGNGEIRRECFKRALSNLLSPEEMKRVHDLSLPFPSSPDGGDVTIVQGNTWLKRHGMILIPVTDRYIKKGGILFHLLQELDCRFVIKVKLTMNDGSGVAHHFFAYDGTTLHDEPKSIKPSRGDRSEKENCLSIFQELFPKEQFSDFEVTNVFELGSIRA